MKKRVHKVTEPEWTVEIDFNTGCRIFRSTDQYGVADRRRIAQVFPELEMFDVHLISGKS